MRPILILKTGSTSPNIREAEQGDYEDWIIRVAGFPAGDFSVVDVALSGQIPAASRYRAIIITGSHDMVSDAGPDTVKVLDWLRAVPQSGTPVLGICFGHQLIGKAFGGDVADHPFGGEHGTHRIRTAPGAVSDPLFSALPAEFPAHESHSQSVLQLPPNAKLLAGSANDPHQAFVVHGKIWGVQFHPEFSESAMELYLEKAEHGRINPVVAATPEATQIINRFLNFAVRQEHEK